MSDLIIFDIDGTLFNPEKFGSLIRNKFTKILRVTEEELIHANAEYYAELNSRSDFNPRGITEFLSKRFSGEKKELDEVFWNEPKIYEDCLYDETKEVLGKLSVSHKKLGIFSQGDEALQLRKLEAPRIASLFTKEYIFIHEKKLTDAAIELLPRECFVVDDNHEVVTALKKLVTPIWMNRRTDDKDPEVQTIHDLKGLFAYL